MKRFVFAAVLAALSVGARAADVAAPQAAPVVSWTGAYAGFELGYGRVGGRVEDPFCVYTIACPGSQTSRTNAFDIGATVGYDWQINSSWVVGGVAKVQGVFGEDLKLYSEFTGNLRVADSLRALGSLNARAGYLVDPDTLLYATGGVAMAQFQTKHWTPNPRDGSNRTFTGWDLGLGAERKLTQNVSMSLEAGITSLGTRPG
jgi:outer membrane immunogenic protein